MKLGTEHARLELALEAARMITWEMDPQSGAISFPGPTEGFFGQGSIEPFQTWASSLLRIHPKDREEAKASLRRALENSSDLEQEYRLLMPDGVYRWCLSKGRVLPGDGPQPGRLLGVTLDITERKRTNFLLQAQRDIGVALSLTSNLQEGLEKILQILVQMEGIDCGGVYLLDPMTGELRLAAHRGLSEAFISQAFRYGPETHEGRLVSEGRTIYALFEEIAPPREAFTVEGLKALAVLPLCHEGAVLGALNLASHATSAIPPRARVEIEAIASQVAGAIARIRTGEALQASEARLRRIVRDAPVMLFAADRAGNLTFEEGQGLIALGTHPGQHVGQPLACAYQACPELVRQARRALRGEQSSFLAAIGPLEFDWCYSPTRDRTGAITGFIGVGTNITERRLLERQLLDISDREQARIGQEIHDGLSQQLVSLAFDANMLDQQLSVLRSPHAAIARRLADLLDVAISESRQLSRGLFPIRIESEGLPSALEELAAGISERFQVRCRFRLEGSVAVPGKSVAIHLYRIAQEAVTNAVRHGRPRNIRLALASTSSGLELSIEDDGLGIVGKPGKNPAGMGLHIMDYRARSIGGALHVAPGKSCGTRVSCCVDPSAA